MLQDNRKPRMVLHNKSKNSLSLEDDKDKDIKSKENLDGNGLTRDRIEEDKVMDAVSSAIIGSLCAYVNEFGTPSQKRQTSLVVGSIFKVFETQQENRNVKRSNENEIKVDWQELRQRLHHISGEWLWLHATNHFKLCIAEQMQIPSHLLEKGLHVERPKTVDRKNKGKGDGTIGNEDTKRNSEYQSNVNNKYYFMEPDGNALDPKSVKN